MQQYKEIALKLSSQFDKAKASGDLNYYESTSEDFFTEDNSRFELRICPALQKKEASIPTPVKSSEEHESPLPQHDPFEAPYNTDLFIGKVGQGEGEEKMVCLLNKFSLVPHHYLLVTEEFQSQSSPLHPPHLVHAYRSLLALRSLGRSFVAIYNCGETSGASQKRRHLQLLPTGGFEAPVDEWTRGIKLEREDIPFQLPQLDFAHAVYRLPTNLSANTPELDLSEQLQKAHHALLDSMFSQIWSLPPGCETPPPSGRSVSYNIVMTLSHITIVPRYLAKSPLVSPSLSMNSMAFAGLILCQSDEQLAQVKNVGPAEVMKSVCYVKEGSSVEVDDDLKTELAE